MAREDLGNSGIVGQVSATDVDFGSGSSITYTILPAKGSNDFVIDTDTVY